MPLPLAVGPGGCIAADRGPGAQRIREPRGHLQSHLRRKGKDARLWRRLHPQVRPPSPSLLPLSYYRHKAKAPCRSNQQELLYRKPNGISLTTLLMPSKQLPAVPSSAGESAHLLPGSRTRRCRRRLTMFSSRRQSGGSSERESGAALQREALLRCL